LRGEGVSKGHRDVITGDLVFCLGKAGRRQEFFYRKMHKLYDLGTSDIDNDKKTGASRKHRVYWIFQAPSLVELWNGPCLEIECEELRQFSDTEWAGGHSDTLKKSMGKFPVCLIDLSQRTLVRLVKCPG